MGDLDPKTGLADRIHRFQPKGLARRWIFAIATAAFAIGFVLALFSVDLTLSQIEWLAMAAVLLIGVPLMTLANAGEYKVAGALVGNKISNSAAIRIAVLSTAANLLPIPGGPLVRAKALMDEGTRPPRAILVTMLMAGAWLATSLLLAGLFGGLERSAAAALVAIGVLIGIGVGTVLGARIIKSNHLARLGAVAAVELLATLATGFRIWLVAEALGLDVGTGALVLGVAPVLGAAVVFVPAGLGVRELIASLAAPAIGLDPAMGFLIAAVDRLAGMLVHGTAAGFIAVRMGRGNTNPGVV